MVAIVNQTFVNRFLNGERGLGRRVILTAPSRAVQMEIVGVVADAVYMSLRESMLPTVFTPLAQFYLPPSNLSSTSLSVRASGAASEALSKSVAAAIAEVNPDISLEFRRLADQVSDSLARERVTAMLAGFFGGLALLLAALASTE